MGVMWGGGRNRDRSSARSGSFCPQRRVGDPSSPCTPRVVESLFIIGVHEKFKEAGTIVCTTQGLSLSFVAFANLALSPSS